MTQSPPPRREAPVVVLALLAVAACAKSDEEWLAELADPDRFVRGTAAIALSVQAPARAGAAVDVLISSLDGPPDLAREHAPAALARIAAADPAATLEQLLRQEALSNDARAALLDALAGAGGPAIPRLVEAMRAPGRSNAREVGMLLVRIGEPALPALVSMLEEDPDPAMRRSAAWLLGQLGPQARPALPALSAAVREGEPFLARLAAQSLQGIDVDGASTLPVLREALARAPRPGEPLAPSGRGVVGAAAAESIARAQVARAQALSPDERAAALREIAACGDDALPGLIEGLGSSIPARARFALDAILPSILRSSFARPRSPPDGRRLSLLVGDLDHELPAGRARGALELGRLGRFAAAALPSLLERLGDKRAEVRTCAALGIWLAATDVAARGLAARGTGGRSAR